jgi:hypothetical protein
VTIYISGKFEKSLLAKGIAVIPLWFCEPADEKVKGEVTFLLNFTLPMPPGNGGQTSNLPESAVRAIPLPRITRAGQPFQ